MYGTHFGLRGRPFRTTPDTAQYYPATTHERALARILRAMEDQEGLILLTAEPGMGKTLLCHAALERLGSDVTSAFLTNGHLRDRLGLLQAILYELRLPYEGCTEQDARLALTEFLLQNYAGGRKTLLVMDEAHHLPADLLEELRMLGNLEAGTGKALQIIVVAQPQLADVLGMPELAAFRQRLAARARLDPWSVEEAADYLRHQIRLAGGRPDALLAEEAVVTLAQGTQGVPRLLNQAAHQAFLFAHEAGAAQVDAEAALEALAALGLDVAENPSPFVTDAEGKIAPMSTEDSGPLLSFVDAPADAVLSLASDALDGREDSPTAESERLVPPKRPA